MAGLTAALVLFILPGNEAKSRALNWSQATTIDWSSLLLFGSGLAFGNLLIQSGATDLIATHLPDTTTFTGLLILAFIVVMLSEVMSNTACANIVIPVVIASNHAQTSITPVLAAALASSLAFMMPVGTPANTIVYGTGKVRLQHMLKMGLAFNILSALVIAFTLRYLA